MQEAHNKLKEPENRVKLLKAGFTGSEIEQIYIITGSMEVRRENNRV